MNARRQALGTALGAFLVLGAIQGQAEAQTVCGTKQQARAAHPGGYLYWRGGPKGQRCWYTRNPTNRPGSINSRPVTVTGQRADSMTGQKATELTSSAISRPVTVTGHPGNNPGQGPVNLMEHPKWAWVEMARLNPTDLDPPPGVAAGGLATAVLREHDLPGATVYTSFVDRIQPEVWPDIKSYPGKQSTALWGAVVALLALLGAAAWWAAGSFTPPELSRYGRGR